MNVADLKKFVDLVKQAETILDSDVEWELKYEMLFSPEIAGEIEQLNMLPDDYVDPDGGYDEDVRAFVDALKRKRDKVKPLVDKLLDVAL